MKVLAILFGFTILMNASSFAAIHGRFAQQLELSGSSVIPYIPWTALVIYILAVFTISKVTTKWKRWVSFVAVTIVMNAVTTYPVGVLERGSTRIPIDDFLNRDSKTTLEANYPIKWVSYSRSGEGTCIRVRRDDYSDSLAEFVSTLVEKQAE